MSYDDIALANYQNDIYIYITLVNPTNGPILQVVIGISIISIHVPNISEAFPTDRGESASLHLQPID